MKTFNSYIQDKEIDEKIFETSYLIAQLGIDPFEYLLESSKDFPQIEVAILEYKDEVHSAIEEGAVAAPGLGQMVRGAASWAANKVMQWALKSSPQLFGQAAAILQQVKRQVDADPATKDMALKVTGAGGRTGRNQVKFGAWLDQTLANLQAFTSALQAKSQEPATPAPAAPAPAPAPTS